MIDLDAKLLAQGFIQRGRDSDRRLLAIGRVEHTLPMDFGGHVLDLDLTLGRDALFGELHVERAAVDVHVTHEVRGDGIVEPRSTWSSPKRASRPRVRSRSRTC